MSILLWSFRLKNGNLLVCIPELKDSLSILLQVNLFQKHLFFHQLTHNLTKDCSLNYEFSTWKLQAQNMLCTQIVFLFLYWHSEQFMYTTCSELVVFMYWTRNSMNNLLSYCGLVDARISASEKDLPVPLTLLSPCTLLWLPSSSNVFLRKKHDCRLRSALSTTQAFETESRTK